MMGARLPAILVLLMLIVGCGGDNAVSTITTVASTTTGTAAPTPACPPADGVGLVRPAVSIYSVTFVINGREQVVRDGWTLEAVPGDEVLVAQVEICANEVDGGRGEACVDIAPLGRDGEEIRSQAGGTHLQPVPSGFAAVPGPPTAWTIGEGWQGFTVVLNHWVRGASDLGCAEGRCERDDYMRIPLP
jgi:hypothetical protein